MDTPGVVAEDHRDSSEVTAAGIMVGTAAVVVLLVQAEVPLAAVAAPAAAVVGGVAAVEAVAVPAA